MPRSLRRAGTPIEELDRLLRIMARLRGPRGCPWDRAQTHETLKPFLVEETYEVLEAIDRGNPAEVADELGDLLLQIVFHAAVAREAGTFDLGEVARRISDKLVRRHPHVFRRGRARTPEEVLVRWNELKKKERPHASALEGVPKALPALLRAQRLSDKAVHEGFEWPNLAAVLRKVREEERELREARRQGRKRIEEELGDLLFTWVNVARKLGVSAEESLRGACDRFESRFRTMERLAAGKKRPLRRHRPQELGRLWERAKGST